MKVIKLKSDKDVLEIDKLIAKKPMLFFIYAPWCTHCKAMKPEWEKAKDMFKDRADVHAVEVDEEGYNNLLHKLHVSPAIKGKVTGYPTLLCVKGTTQPTIFTGNREAKSIAIFITEHFPKSKTATIVPSKSSPKTKTGGALKKPTSAAKPKKATKPKKTDKPRPKTTNKPKRKTATKSKKPVKSA